METLKSVEKEWLDVKCKYQDLINERLSLLKDEDYTLLTHQNGGLTKYFPDELRLYKRSEELRKKLIHLNPKKFHCGKVNDSYAKNKAVPKLSIQGDEGFFSCFDCHGLFGYEESVRRIKKLRKSKTSGRVKKEHEVYEMETGTFLCCKFHKGLKRYGVMKKNFTLGE
jgi:hypothetical protein